MVAFGANMFGQNQPAVIIDTVTGSGTLWARSNTQATFNEDDWVDELAAQTALYDAVTGLTVERYQQFYSDIRVEEGQITVIYNNGQPIKGAGRIHKFTEYDLTSILSMDYARAFAEEYLLSLIDTLEFDTVNHPLASSLVVANRKNQYGLDGLRDYQLCYRFLYSGMDPYVSGTVYINAYNGNVFDTRENVQFCSSGSGYTSYNGLQSINGKYKTPPWKHKLMDDCRGEKIHTRVNNRDGFNSRKKFDKHSRCSEVWDGDNYWDDPEDAPVVSLHWAGEMWYDYFDASFNRNGLDGNGVEILLVYHKNYLPVYSNYAGGIIGQYNPPTQGYWDRNIREAHFGSGNYGVGPIVSLDWVAHELTHGLIDYQGIDLLHVGNEANSLNESFADIFGTCVEFYAENLYNSTITPDWLIFEDVFGGPYRSMEDPGVLNHPIAYQGTNWDFSTNPDLQRNGSVQNYMFYLLSQGSWNKSTQNNIPVCGIGMDKAAQIAYRALTVYLGTNSTFADSRIAWINAAEDIYGVTSNEASQVRNAWAAVNVGSMGSSCTPVSQPEAISMLANVEIWPNPANQQLNIRFPEDVSMKSVSKIELADMNGRVQFALENIGSGTINSRNIQLDCSDFPSGIYIFTCKAGARSTSQKVVINH
jgi:Zn-dependent metalloprotease